MNQKIQLYLLLSCCVKIGLSAKSLTVAIQMKTMQQFFPDVCCLIF